jgi:hypothetical protein
MARHRLSAKIFEQVYNTDRLTPSRTHLSQNSTMANHNQSQILTGEQVDHFLKHGYVHLTGCFTRETAQRWTGDMWTRLGYNPSNRSTWLAERINMPNHRSESIKTFAPTAWQAICDLLGGEDRITHSSATWEDGLIVNLGKDSQDWIKPRDLRGWHVDGDSFVHFLNSPEQGLLVIPLFSDIQPHGGGTILCPEGIKEIAKHLVCVETVITHPSQLISNPSISTDKILVV